MSREAVSDFLHAVEHSQRVRHAAASCRSDNELIALANQLGFLVNQADLNQDSRDSAITQWFEISRITSSFQSPPT
ncbi:MAG: Nif11-like leader peptide family natural product precursor [Synechococcus sp. BS307-5m-G36]|nr:Nif11-like leader peptide family natural product precursor [Synechococcus sp. BS307-5m-G36]MBL6881259.1 Nif11-like leader peptide family natural product precursor [Synechococcus sp. BS30m-G31]